MVPVRAAIHFAIQSRLRQCPFPTVRRRSRAFDFPAPQRQFAKRSRIRIIFQGYRAHQTPATKLSTGFHLFHPGRFWRCPTSVALSAASATIASPVTGPDRSTHCRSIHSHPLHGVVETALHIRRAWGASPNVACLVNHSDSYLGTANVHAAPIRRSHPAADFSESITKYYKMFY